MKKYLLITALITVSVLLINSCKEDDDETPTPSGNTKNIILDITGLKDLGSSAQYEGWILVNNNPVSTGKFSVNPNGTLSKTVFTVNADQLNNATAYIITIEPNPDNSPVPHDRHIMAGEFSNNNANLSVGHAEALGVNLAASTGSFILATPTDGGMTTNELSGAWFLNPGSSSPGDESPALNLPDLPAGWIYEGWAVINGTPLTTGKFEVNNTADQSAPYSGALAGPPFPGEDFLQNAPAGFIFPPNLQSDTIVITVEPVPDTGNEPFFLSPLKEPVIPNATDHNPYQLTNIAAATFPAGTATR
jgi:hypothetical protein